jgi:pimeloyl-ACP methyl ester carboxylesterase
MRSARCLVGGRCLRALSGLIVWAVSALAVAQTAPGLPVPPAPAVSWRDCALDGVSQQVRCGSLMRPLDPARPKGQQIEIHFALLPALARNKKPDALVVLAGGPGQSAINLAGPLSRQWARALNRRDLLLVDQRGTGRSANLDCERDPVTAPLAWADLDQQLARLAECREALRKKPHGDLRFYSTGLAMADLEAVRQAVGLGPVNVIAASYGTRAALEFQRLYPASVRRAVLDGAAPPDMVLPASMSGDVQASWDAVLRACEEQPRCRQAHGPLRERFAALLASLPREVEITHPVTGRREQLVLTRDMLLSWVRLPLYVPALAAGLPHAVAQASEGRMEALVGLASSFGGARQRAAQLALGMHFSVVCAEDGPRMAAAGFPAGTDFGEGMLQLYQRACADWPRGTVDEAFYRMVPARSAVLVLSGGADPATPPRHGERVVQALGPLARHWQVAQAGHGLLALGCMPDAVLRFLDAADETQALAVDLGCAANIPRPAAFVPVGVLDAAGRRSAPEAGQPGGPR